MGEQEGKKTEKTRTTWLGETTSNMGFLIAGEWISSVLDLPSLGIQLIIITGCCGFFLYGMIRVGNSNHKDMLI